MNLGILLAALVAVYAVFALLGLFPVDEHKLLLCVAALAVALVVWGPVEHLAFWRREPK